MSSSTVELDIQTVHSDDIGEPLGEFFGSIVRFWDASASRQREDADMILRIEQNKTEGRISVLSI